MNLRKVTSTALLTTLLASCGPKTPIPNQQMVRFLEDAEESKFLIDNNNDGLVDEVTLIEYGRLETDPIPGCKAKSYKIRWTHHYADHDSSNLTPFEFVYSDWQITPLDGHCLVNNENMGRMEGRISQLSDADNIIRMIIQAYNVPANLPKDL